MDSGKYDGAADGNWENCVRSQEDWGVIVLGTMFLVPCIFFNKCPYFSYYVAEYPMDRPHILVCVSSFTHHYVYEIYLCY